MKKLYCLWFLFGFAVFSQAQDQDAIQNDSLLTIISNTNNDSIKANAYAQLGEIWQAKSFQKTIKYTQQALKYARKYGNWEQEVGIMFGLGYAYMNIGNADASIDVLQQVLLLVKEKNLELHGMALNFMSQNYVKQEDYPNALKCMREALALMPQMAKEKIPLSQQSYLACYSDLANIFSKSNQIDSALYYAAIAYKRLHSVKIEPQSRHFTWNIPRIYGDAHRKAKHNEAAMKLYREALKSAQKQNFQTAIYSVKLSLAYLFEQTKQLDSALVHAQEALIGFQQSADYPQLAEAGLLLHSLYKRTNNPAQALQYFEIGMSARDSVLSREKILQVQYLTDKQERQKRELEIEIEQKQSSQRLYILLAGFLLFVIITLILYRNNRQKQRLNKQLAQQKIEIEELNEGLEQKVDQRTAELQKALNEVQTAFGQGQYTERKRVSADLHDEIGSALSTIAIFSDVTKRKAQKTAPELVSELEKIGSKSREMVQTMRDTIWTLNDDTTQNLWERMQQYSLETLSAKDIMLNWQIPNDLPNNLPFLIKRNLFLAYKEAIHNIVKHAEATIVSVECQMRNDKLWLMVADNGKGFDLEVARNEGNGLQNFQKRMAELGGTAQIESIIDEGTRLTFVIPVTNP